MNALALHEVRVAPAPHHIDDQPLRRWAEEFGAGDPLARLTLAGGRVALRPRPIRCPLPSPARGRPGSVRGFAHLAIAEAFGDAVIASLTACIAPIEDETLRSRPSRLLSPVQAVTGSARLSIVEAGREAQLLEAAEEQYGHAARFPSSFDPGAVLDAVAVPLIGIRRGAEAWLAEPQRGRLLCAIADGGDATEVQAYSTVLEGSASPYVLLRARLSPELGAYEVNRHVSALRLALEHIVAHRWLLECARRLNALQLVSIRRTLLDREAQATDITDARYELLNHQSEYIERLDRHWRYGLDLPPEARDAVATADAVLHLGEGWTREAILSAHARSIGESAATLTRRRREISDLPTKPQVDSRRAMQNPFRQVVHWLRSSYGVRRDGYVTIEKHPEDNRFALFEEINASIALTTFMTTAAVVFLGLILSDAVDTKREKVVFRGSIPSLDILYLFVASFGFLFATLVYANSSGWLARIGTYGFERKMEVGNAVSEYMGVYPLLFAVPLTVARYLQGGFVAWAVAAIAIVALAGYHYAPEASLLERDISDGAIGNDRQRKYVWIPLMLVAAGMLYAGALLPLSWLVYVGGGALFVLLVLLLLFSLAAPDRPDPTLYRIDPWDALGEETRSRVDPDWRRALRERRLGHPT